MPVALVDRCVCSVACAERAAAAAAAVGGFGSWLGGCCCGNANQLAGMGECQNVKENGDFREGVKSYISGRQKLLSAAVEEN